MHWSAVECLVVGQSVVELGMSTDSVELWEQHPSATPQANALSVESFIAGSLTFSPAESLQASFVLFAVLSLGTRRPQIAVLNTGPASSRPDQSCAR
jgi:hypothetical protein